MSLSYRFLFLLLILQSSMSKVCDAKSAVDIDFAPLIEQGGNVTVPAGTYKLTRRVRIIKPTTIHGIGHVLVDCSEIPGNSVISIEASNVTIQNLKFFGSKLSSKNNGYVIQTNNGAFERIELKRVDISFFGSISSDFSIAHHAIYLQNVHYAKITNCRISSVSGAGVFLKNCKRVKVKANLFMNTGWYSIQLYSGCDDIKILDNVINGDHQNARKHGGSIDIMSQHYPPSSVNRNVLVKGNDISGTHNYGGAIRVLSSENVTILKNYIHDAYQVKEKVFSYIRVGRRGDIKSGTYSKPCKAFIAKKNKLKSNKSYVIGILIDNQYAAQMDPHIGVSIIKNEFIGNFKLHFLAKHNRAGIEGLKLTHKRSQKAKTNFVVEDF